MENERSIPAISTAKEILLTVFLFTIIYVNNCFLVINGTVSIALLCLLTIAIVVVQTSLKIDKGHLGIILFLGINVLATTVLVNDSPDNAILMVLSILFSYFVVASVEFNLLVKIFTRILFIAAVFSLIVYFLAVTNSEIIKLFPVVNNLKNFQVYNLGLSFVNLRGTPIRNMSFFWEPGAFQTFLVFALIFEVFIYKMKRRINIAIFIVALITTWSTAGVVNLMLLIVIMLLYISQQKKTKYVGFFATLFILIAMVLWIYSYLPPSMQYAVLGKLTHFFDSGSSTNVTSASVRFDSITVAVSALLSSPLWGVGNNAFKDFMFTSWGHSMTTNTLLNWFAVYGSFFGVIMTYLIYKLSKILTGNYRILLLLVILSIVLSISTEQYLRNMSVIMIIFLPFSLRHNPEVYEEAENQDKKEKGCYREQT